jgi:hypothetical protein
MIAESTTQIPSSVAPRHTHVYGLVLVVNDVNARGLWNLLHCTPLKRIGLDKVGFGMLAAHNVVGLDADPTAGWQAVQCKRLRLTRVRGVPFPSEALCLGDLFGGHLGGDAVAAPHPSVPVIIE